MRISLWLRILPRVKKYYMHMTFPCHLKTRPNALRCSTSKFVQFLTTAYSNIIHSIKSFVIVSLSIEKTS